MEKVMMLDHDVKNIGLYTRSVTEGEELELVKEFIDYYKAIIDKDDNK